MTINLQLLIKNPVQSGILQQKTSYSEYKLLVALWASLWVKGGFRHLFRLRDMPAAEFQGIIEFYLLTVSNCFMSK